jgi:integrase
MRTRFYIEKRRDASGNLLSVDRPVFMSVSAGGSRILIATGIKADLNGWDESTQRIRTSLAGAERLNSWLDSMQELAARVMKALNHSGEEVNPGNFRRLFQQLRPRYSKGFFDLFFQFMESNSSRWSKATYLKVRALYRLLREFEDQDGDPLAFHTMDSRFLERFIAYCREKGYRQSTIYRTVNNLVWFLNWTHSEGYNPYLEYRQFYKKLDVPGGSAGTPVYLHWNELMMFMDYLPENRRMERAVDLFCFMCFTGVRYSELQRLKKEDIRDRELIVRKPGGRSRTVPMNDYALKICEKYENKYYLHNTAFPSMSLVTMNRYLRLAGSDTGLTRMVDSNTKGEGSRPINRTLTAGIAVNTFIRNALKMEMPASVISRFTGIRNDHRLQRIHADLSLQMINGDGGG